MELLIQKLGTIEDTILDKKVKLEERRKLFEEAGQRYKIVDRALKGEISISDIVERLRGRYQGLRLFLPRLKDKEYDKTIDDLQLDELFQACFFRTDISKTFAEENPHLGRLMGWFYDKLANPAGTALLVGGFSAVGFKGHSNYPSWVIIGTVAGGLIGVLGSFIRHSEMYLARNQANYLQEQINLYRQSRTNS